ncbi:hypothetical protein CPB84DRAFT_1747146 [Gymnopilus junonius]|uniref:Uncharacterized protein n=1 Tax=Gymnopilus junonius TaxID=109634 RepID=A0A9P5NR23_GYMJU|nr:hypothetical protein CPB84DRAFT_1747146 [Gymnopilus junonius]
MLKITFVRNTAILLQWSWVTGPSQIDKKSQRSHKNQSKMPQKHIQKAKKAYKSIKITPNMKQKFKKQNQTEDEAEEDENLGLDEGNIDDFELDEDDDDND